MRPLHAAFVLALLPATTPAQAPSAPSGADAGAAGARALLRELTAEPRLAGTVGSRWGAEIVKKHLVAAGWQVELDEREVLLSYPRSLELTLHADGGAGEPLARRAERFDPDAARPGDVPMYNAWSASGTVRARVVDAGYGTRADFARLKALGLDLAGTIALVRYGRSYRGIKVDLAAEFGCAGVLLYSDPASDGPAKGPVWPEGPWKPDDDAQRGSILPITHVPGDPSTPGWASARPGAACRRIAGNELDAALPRIPCLPIGAREALLLRERLAPVKVPAAAEGGAPAASGEERLGPGPVEARMVVDAPRSLRTVINVIARLPGASERMVIAGAHRDAWVRGANDDGSGVVALVRAAQRLSERAKSGWKPANTIVLAFWDAEEFGLIGSTEYGEAHADRLRALALAYLNADVGVSGTRFQGAGGAPGLLGTLRRVLERIPAAQRPDVLTPGNLWEEWKEGGGRRGSSDRAREPRLGLQGSGSDFAVFLHHLSIPTLDLGFGGASSGQYHTAFDDFELVERFVDPGFVGHELCGRLFAELLGELADAGPLAHDPVEAALALAELAAEQRDAAKKTAPALAGALHQLGGGLRQLASSLQAPPPRREDLVDLGTEPRWRLAPEYRFYRALEHPEGLPGRPWFKNSFWAPGLEDGYGAESFPTLRAAAAANPEALQAELERLMEQLAGAVPQFPD
jgi:N-acetylated-alpha-linked acidic dipeptidase